MPEIPKNINIDDYRYKKAVILTRHTNLIGDCTQYFNNKLFEPASFRLQVKPLVKALIKAKYRHQLISLNSKKPEHLDLVGKPDIAIAAKLSARAEDQANMSMSNLAALARLKYYKIPIATIYSDNRAIEEEYPTGEFHRNLLAFSDLIICPSRKLAKAAQLHTRTSKIIVIEDPWQIRSEMDFKSINNQQKINIIWFGQATNFKYFMSIFPEMLTIKSKSNGVKFEVTILTESGALAQLKKLDANSLPTSWSLRMVEWKKSDQPKQLEDELARAHIALIPSDPNDPRKNGVSHNRLIDSLRAGCIPITSPLDSYKELDPSVILTNDFRDSLISVLNNYELVKSKIERNRVNFMHRFSPSENERKWDQAVKILEGIAN